MMTLNDLDLPAGELRQRVTLEQLVETPDAYNQRVKSFAPIGTFWAAIRPTSGSGTVIADQLTSEVTHAVILRGNPNVTADPSYRLLYRGRVFNLEAVLNVRERGKKTVLLCSEQVKPRTT